MDEVTRRNRLDLCTPAEKAIYEATYEIEKIGADVRLTEAQNLLDKARNLIADYIDNVPAPAAPDKGEELLQKSDKITEDAKAKLDVKLQQIIDRDYSVEKSEGEEAARRMLKVHLDPIRYERLGERVIDRIVTAMIDFATLHSSGDRGRKEWPGEQEIKAFMFNVYRPTETDSFNRGLVDGIKRTLEWLKDRK